MERWCAAPSPPAGPEAVAASARAQVAARVDLFWDVINETAIRYQVAQSLIQAVIHQESGGNPDALREEPRIADASYGLMQLLCATALGLGFDRECSALFDVRTNIDLGTRYLAALLRQYRALGPALVHYNGGGRSARRYLRGERGFPADRYRKAVQNLTLFYVRWNRVRER